MDIKYDEIRGRKFVVFDEAIGEYWRVGGFTPIKADAEVYTGVLNTRHEISAFNDRCHAELA